MMLGKFLYDNLVRHIAEVTMLIDVIHVSMAGKIKFLEEGIVAAIKFEGVDTKPLTKTLVKGWCRFSPLSLQVDFSITVPKINITADQFIEFRCG